MPKRKRQHPAISNISSRPSRAMLDKWRLPTYSCFPADFHSMKFSMRTCEHGPTKLGVSGCPSKTPKTWHCANRINLGIVEICTALLDILATRGHSRPSFGQILAKGSAIRIQLDILRHSIHIASLFFVWLLQHYPSLFMMKRVGLALHLLYRKHACMGRVGSTFGGLSWSHLRGIAVQNAQHSKMEVIACVLGLPNAPNQGSHRAPQPRDVKISGSALRSACKIVCRHDVKSMHWSKAPYDAYLVAVKNHFNRNESIQCHLISCQEMSSFSGFRTCSAFTTTSVGSVKCSRRVQKTPKSKAPIESKKRPRQGTWRSRARLLKQSTILNLQTWHNNSRLARGRTWEHHWGRICHLYN